MIIDDFLLTTLADWEQRDLLEVIEDRYQLGATIIASQCPIGDWHPNIGDSTLADALPEPFSQGGRFGRTSGRFGAEWVADFTGIRMLAR